MCDYFKITPELYRCFCPHVLSSWHFYWLTTADLLARSQQHRPSVILQYDSNWDWTFVYRTTGEHSKHYTNGPASYYNIIILSCPQHGYHWPSLDTPPYRSSLLVGLQGYTMHPYRAAVWSFELAALLLHGQVKRSIGVHHLWTRLFEHIIHKIFEFLFWRKVIYRNHFEIIFTDLRSEFSIDINHHHHHHHHVVPQAQISLTLSCHFSLSFIASGRSSGPYIVSSQSCWMYVRAGRPDFARPYAGVHRSTSLMSSSLLLHQCPSCLVRLTCIVFVTGGKWSYSWCLVGCCRQDLFNIAWKDYC